SLKLHPMATAAAAKMLSESERAPFVPKCPECGTDGETLRRTGLLGCPNCYEVFRRQLEPLLRSVHHAVDHNPRSERDDPVSRLERVLESLRRELSESVRREEFERAASIRDEIRRYEKEKAELSSPEADEEGEDA
ncbi:MAG TPA: UvrB/UvrC motif-containing protein, partial [Candidatus Krumholzibacteria bacterium]|nr:UvrB/UvrC motif-containing protein [Candidatus Krumholzibacteria bacterium]